jgi:GNAT superfamily N-acetyltransferase
MAEIELTRDETDEALERGMRLVTGVFPERAIAVSELRGWIGPFPHVHLVASQGGEDVGFALGVAEPEMRDANEAFGMAVVPEALRGRGVGSALHAALSAWAREAGIVGFRGHVVEGDEASLAWTRRRGFEETGRELRLELDLTTFDPPPVGPPEGVEIVTWAERPDAARGLYDVYLEASPDIPGDEDDALQPYEGWLANHMGGPGDLPEATFVAFAGDEVVGYSKFSLTEAQPTVAFHDLTGVKRAWRGRGVASALKRMQMAWAKEHGYERLVTNNEERNEPIRRLNERYGYRPVPGRIFVRGPLTP